METLAKKCPSQHSGCITAYPSLTQIPARSGQFPGRKFGIEKDWRLNHPELARTGSTCAENAHWPEVNSCESAGY
jgi:hypothetical protein